MRKLFLCLVLVLAGCATSKSFDSDLTSLQGRPIHDAIARFGPPNAETDLDNGGHSYVWMQNYDVHMSTAPPPNQYGMIPPSQLASGEQAQGQSYTQSVRCWVRVETDSAGKITDSKWSGNIGSCDRYASRFGGL
jgi:hypothetical protein